MIRHDSLRLCARGFMSVPVCLLAMVFAMIFAVALAAPSAVAQTTTPQYLFLSTSVPNGQGAFVQGIVTYIVDTTTGALTQITPSPVQTRGVPGPLAINNSGTFLFAIGTNSAGQGAVESFNVASDGSLTEVGTSPYTISNTQAAPMTVAVSPNGAYLSVASEVPFNESTEAPQSTIVDVFAVASNGSLTLNNTFAYSAVEACDPPTPAELTPIQFFVHPTQKWLYLFMGSSYGPPCSGQPSEVQQFTINSDGTLTAPGTPSILPLYATNGYALTGSPDGTLLFLMTKQNTENGIIYASGIDQTNGGFGFALAYSYPFLGNLPVLSTGGLAVDSTSTYLYSSAGTFLIQDGTITALDSISSPYTSGASLLASPSLPFIFAQTSAPDSNPFFFERPSEQRRFAHARSGLAVHILGPRSFERRYTDSHQSRDVDSAGQPDRHRGRCGWANGRLLPQHTAHGMYRHAECKHHGHCHVHRPTSFAINERRRARDDHAIADGSCICVGDGDHANGSAQHRCDVHELVGRRLQRQHEHDVRIQHFGKHIGDGDVLKSACGDDADAIANGRGGRLVYVPAERDRILDDAYVYGELLDTGRLVHDRRDDAGGNDDGANCDGRASSDGVGRTFEWRRKWASRRQ